MPSAASKFLVRPATQRSADALALLAILAAWAAYSPLGIKYLAYILLGLASLAWLHQSGQMRASMHSTLLRLPLILVFVLSLSATWSDAPIADRLTHVWHYGRLLFMPFILLACPPGAANRALRHFLAASIVVAGLTAVNYFYPLPDKALLSSTIQADGNQRIATSLLLALGCSLAIIESIKPDASMPRRAGWLLGAAFIAVALAVQDRRTGMVTLPVLLLILIFSRKRVWWRSLGWLIVLFAAAGISWQTSDMVRARFAEGLSQLRTYRSTDAVTTSWGMRMRMVELTADMVKDRPLMGHGLGSWVTQWHARIGPEGKRLKDNTSPHNEYLLIAEQAGLPALAAWLALLAAYLLRSWRAGAAGLPGLMVWSAFAWASLFSVTIRDAKFAMPLLLLAALALAASRAAEIDSPKR